METIILAAGRGTRLGRDAFPKCLLPVAGRSLLAHHLAALVAAGVPSVTICVGHRADAVRARVAAGSPALAVRWVVNPLYATTENAYTLRLALETCPGEDLLLINADNLLDRRIYERLLGAAGSLLPYAVKAAYDAEDVKITWSAGRPPRLTAIGKDIPPRSALGESIGIRRLRTPFSTLFRDALFAMTEGEGAAAGHYFEAIGAAVRQGGVLPVLDVTPFGYADIDAEQDLERARSTAGAMCLPE